MLKGKSSEVWNKTTGVISDAKLNNKLWLYYSEREKKTESDGKEYRIIERFGLGHLEVI